MHDMTRCGECSECIDHELLILSMMEEALYEESEGDTTKYLNLMGEWIDMFIEQGLQS